MCANRLDCNRIQLSKFQVDIENNMFESYKGPETKVDLILLCNVLMYIPDSAGHQVTRCLQWLKPGGHLLKVGRKCTRADLLLSMILKFFIVTARNEVEARLCFHRRV